MYHFYVSPWAIRIYLQYCVKSDDKLTPGKSIIRLGTRNDQTLFRGRASGVSHLAMIVLDGTTVPSGREHLRNTRCDRSPHVFAVILGRGSRALGGRSLTATDIRWSVPALWTRKLIQRSHDDPIAFQPACSRSTSVRSGMSRDPIRGKDDIVPHQIAGAHTPHRLCD